MLLLLLLKEAVEEEEELFDEATAACVRSMAALRDIAAATAATDPDADDEDDIFLRRADGVGAAAAAGPAKCDTEARLVAAAKAGGIVVVAVAAVAPDASACDMEARRVAAAKAGGKAAEALVLVLLLRQALTGLGLDFAAASSFFFLFVDDVSFSFHVVRSCIFVARKSLARSAAARSSSKPWSPILLSQTNSSCKTAFSATSCASASAPWLAI